MILATFPGGRGDFCPLPPHYAYSDGCRTLIPISVGQHSDFSRTPFRFMSDSVPG